jgi:hypothetical protein
LVAFNWEEWGWAVGRLGKSSVDDGNVSVLYENQWREEHALLPEMYGTCDIKASWVLLQASRPQSPILGFANGKYMKKRHGSDVLLRADQLIHHTSAELEQAREASKKAKVQVSNAAVEKELDTDGHAVGDRAYAKGHAPGCETAWFEAVVLATRKRYPPIKVMYIKSYPDGDTDALALPQPTTSFVAATHVQADAPPAVE